MKNSQILILLIAICFFSSCSSNKYISSGNKIFEVREKLLPNEGGPEHTLLKLEVKKGFTARIDEKTDYVIIKVIDRAKKAKFDTTAQVIPEDKISSTQIDLTGKKYYPELKLTELNTKSLIYYDIKFGLQALTIPLKFRQSVGNDTINPPVVETGINVGFAPGWKFTRNVYKQTKNYLGKNTDQYALAIGPHFGIGATDLKKASNAPGLLSDRKVPIFTLGGYILIGFNNINVGFAFGKDYVIGQGKKNWVYQGKTWTGIIVSLDILKY